MQQIYNILILQKISSQVLQLKIKFNFSNDFLVKHHLYFIYRCVMLYHLQNKRITVLLFNLQYLEVFFWTVQISKIETKVYNRREGLIYFRTNLLQRLNMSNPIYTQGDNRTFYILVITTLPTLQQYHYLLVLLLIFCTYIVQSQKAYKICIYDDIMLSPISRSIYWNE